MKNSAIGNTLNLVFDCLWKARIHCGTTQTVFQNLLCKLVFQNHSFCRTIMALCRLKLLFLKAPQHPDTIFYWKFFFLDSKICGLWIFAELYIISYHKDC